MRGNALASMMLREAVYDAREAYFTRGESIEATRGRASSSENIISARRRCYALAGFLDEGCLHTGDACRAFRRRQLYSASLLHAWARYRFTPRIESLPRRAFSVSCSHIYSAGSLRHDK